MARRCITPTGRMRAKASLWGRNPNVPRDVRSISMGLLGESRNESVNEKRGKRPRRTRVRNDRS